MLISISQTKSDLTKPSPVWLKVDTYVPELAQLGILGWCILLGNCWSRLFFKVNSLNKWLFLRHYCFWNRLIRHHIIYKTAKVNSTSYFKNYMTCINLGELFTTIRIFVHRILNMHINITNIQSRLISHHYIRIVSHFFLFQLIFLTWTKGVPFIKTPL